MTYLITGGTGSLGHAVVKELLTYPGHIIRIFSRNEYLQWQMESDFKDKRLRFFIGDVRDEDRLRRVMMDVDTVIHCAALKHVPLCEYNPIEAVRTNIDGAVNVINASIDAGVKRVLAISSDKAVYPINLYGATKLVSEKLFIQANLYSETTRFSVVRCGNFWGSKGSVIELWQGNAGTIDITHPDMQRYILPIEEGAHLIVKLSESMAGGEVFIPKMNEVKLSKLADMVAPGVKQNIIGLRVGEKFRESLYTKEEEHFLEDMGEYYTLGGKCADNC